MCYSQILQNFGGDVYLCKLGKEYLNASICKFVIYFYIILKLSTYRARLILNTSTPATDDGYEC